MKRFSLILALSLSCLATAAPAATVERFIATLDSIADAGGTRIIGDVFVNFTGEDGVWGGVVGSSAGAVADGFLRADELTSFDMFYTGVSNGGLDQNIDQNSMRFFITDLDAFTYAIDPSFEPFPSVHTPLYPLQLSVSRNPTQPDFESVFISTTIVRAEEGAGNFVSSNAFVQYVFPGDENLVSELAAVPLPASGWAFLGAMSLAGFALRRGRKASA